jgi:ATP-binding cassette subfamily F protein 3
MAQIQLSSISLSFGDRDILRNVTFTIGHADRTALTGANGSGKTTLLKIVAGSVMPDSGTVSREEGTTVSYLPQGGVSYRGGTLWGEAEKGFELQHRLVREKEELGRRLGGVREGDPETEELVLALHHLEERILDSGYYRREERIEQVLSVSASRGRIS